LLRLAAAAVEQPDELVRTALYRVAARKRCGELCHASGPGMRSPGHRPEPAQPFGRVVRTRRVKSGLL